MCARRQGEATIEMSFPEIHRTEVSGIPTFWGNGPEPYAGALLFRVGKADESFPQSGISHLVEHLAIFPVGRLSHPHGGFVDDTRTVFHASGTPDEVAAYLTAVCRHLGDLPFERLEDERRVLRAESEGSEGAHRLWSLRFGARAHGLTSYMEVGLHWLQADAIAEWASQSFTRDNAAMWFSGPPPEGLDLDLPEGSRRPMPAPRNLEGLQLPAFALLEGNTFGLSLLAERSTAISTATRFLFERTQDHLRRDLGLTYAVGGNYWRLDAETVHLILLADSSPGHAATVRDGLFKVVDDLAESGPTDEELERAVLDAERAWTEVVGVPHLLDLSASDELAGKQRDSPEELMEEMRALGSQDVATAIAVPLETMLLSVPPGVSVPATRAVAWGHGWSSEPVKGKSFDYTDTDGKAIVGELGVSDVMGGRTTAVLYEDCVLVGLEADYAITVFGRTGEAVTIHFPNAKSRDEIREAVLRNVPKDLVAQLYPDVMERQAAVAALAAAQLEKGAEGLALNTLARVLLDGEQANLLAPATHAQVDGLLAVTDMRLLFFERKSGAFSLQIHLNEISSAVRKRGLLRASVEVRSVEGPAFEFTGIAAARAGEIVAEIEARATP